MIAAEEAVLIIIVTLLPALEINILPMPVIMNTKIKKHRSNQIFGGHSNATNKTSLTAFSM